MGWTCKSTRKLAMELTRQGHPLSHTTRAEMLKALGYSLQGTRKTKEGRSHPDCNAQFEYIQAQGKAFQERGTAGGAAIMEKWAHLRF